MDVLHRFIKRLRQCYSAQINQHDNILVLYRQ